MKLSRLVFYLVAMIAVVLFIPDSVLAAKGVNVNFPVKVVGANVEPAKVLKNTFVAMYKVKLKPVAGYDGVYDYEATQQVVKSTGSKGNAAIFVVKPDEVVYFLGFKTKKEALLVKKFIPETPPLKNFSKTDGVKGRLCNTAGTDFSAKFNPSGSQDWCHKSWSVELYKSTDVLMSVEVVDADVDSEKALPNTFVAMYKVGLKKVDGFDEVYDYDATQQVVRSTGKDGLGAKFLVKYGEVVYFLAFETKEEALLVKKHTPETPPLKNFDGAVGQLCRTAGTDFSTKFEPLDGQDWCYKSWSLDLDSK